MYLHICMCIHVCSALICEEPVPDLLELELWTGVTHHVVLGSEAQSSVRAASAFTEPSLQPSVDVYLYSLGGSLPCYL